MDLGGAVVQWRQCFLQQRQGIAADGMVEACFDIAQMLVHQLFGLRQIAVFQCSDDTDMFGAGLLGMM